MMELPKSLLSYNGTGTDIAGTITSDANGNYYATGFTTSPSLFGFSTSGTGKLCNLPGQNIDSNSQDPLGKK